MLTVAARWNDRTRQMFRLWQDKFDKSSINKKGSKYHAAIFRVRRDMSREWGTRYIRASKGSVPVQARMMRHLVKWRGSKAKGKTRRNTKHIPNGVVQVTAMNPELMRIAHPSVTLGRRGDDGRLPNPAFVTPRRPYPKSGIKGYPAVRGYKVPWESGWQTEPKFPRRTIVDHRGYPVQIDGMKSKMKFLLRSTKTGSQRQMRKIMRIHFRPVFRNLLNPRKGAN